MKAKKGEIKVGELFRQKLDGYEIVPDDSVRNELMRKLELQEFLRFNPLRINIWYLALVTILSITAFLLFLEVEPARDQGDKDVVNPPDEITIDKHPAIVSPELQQMAVPEVSDNSGSQSPGGSHTNVNAISPEKIDESSVIAASVSAAPAENNLYELRKSEIRTIEKAPLPGGVYFESSATAGCLPLKIKFFNKTEKFDSCRWTFGEGGFSTKTNPEWIYDSEGEYKVELTVFKEGRLPETSSIIITVYPLPVARFEISPENPSVPGDQMTFINYSSGASGYKWNFGDGKESASFEPRYSYRKQGNYNVRLIAISDKGCTDSVQIDNVLSGGEYFVRFPNAFIPNQLGPSGGYYSARSDETSVVFHPVFSGVTEYQLRIFSKKGIMIFESNDLNIGWDGYIDGVLGAAGVYIWKVKGKYRNGETFTKMGDVTLLKASSN